MGFSWPLLMALLLLITLASLLPVFSTTETRKFSLTHSQSSGQMVLQTGNEYATVLPLKLSTSRFSSRSSLERKLVADAQMPLHDDLLSRGYYTSSLWIGTPAHEFALIVDSGSTVTYVPCSTCTHCGNHQDPKFKPSASSSYKKLGCHQPACPNGVCDQNGQCKYERQYAELSTSSGVLGTDVFGFGSMSGIELQSLVFGCENFESGDLYSQRADGIMGLGRGTLSIVDQMVHQNAISDAFSLCYGGMGEVGGAMILGAIPPPKGMVFTDSPHDRSPYYNIVLKEIRVAGTALPVDASVFDAKYGTVLDSGTTYAYLPEEAFKEFKSAVIQQLGNLEAIEGPDPQNFADDICFAGAGNDPAKLSDYFPTVDLVLGKGEVVSLAPENYLFRHMRVPGAYCLGVFKNNDQSTLLGGILVRNMLVTYDRGGKRIGFWRTKCTDLWSQLGTTKSQHEPVAAPLPVPVPAPTLAAVSVIVPSPVPSPSLGAPIPLSNKIDLNTGVERIELNITLGTNYTVFTALSTAFLQDMASELAVELRQVSLLGYAEEGNEEVSVNCAIVPAGLDYEIPSTTAQKIITQLNDHHVQLHNDFGSYQLISWKLVPHSHRSWLSSKLHQLELVIFVMAGLIAMGTAASIAYWYLSRFRGNQYVKYSTVNPLDDGLEQL